MLKETLGAMRDLPRLHEISSVLIRHGLGDTVRRLGIAGILERAGQMLHFGEVSEAVRLEPAQRVRIASALLPSSDLPSGTPRQAEPCVHLALAEAGYRQRTTVGILEHPPFVQRDVQEGGAYRAADMRAPLMGVREVAFFPPMTGG